MIALSAMLLSYEEVLFDLFADRLAVLHSVLAQRDEDRIERDKNVPKRNVTPCAFCEEDLQWFIKRDDHMRPYQGFTLVVNEVGHDANRKRPDYQLLDKGSLVATCEVKGPVRRTFFDIDAYGRNWTKPSGIPATVRSQLSRTQTHPNARHYLALLLCLAEADVPASMHRVMEKVAATCPGAMPYAFRYRQVSLGNMRSATIAITEIVPLSN
jgi:hypothetical protein